MSAKVFTFDGLRIQFPNQNQNYILSRPTIVTLTAESIFTPVQDYNFYLKANSKIIIPSGSPLTHSNKVIPFVLREDQLAILLADAEVCSVDD